jgi:excisionase family DNA binding protein
MSEAHRVQLVTLRQVAEMLALSVPTVRRLVNMGALRSCRVGRAIRVNVNDVTTFVRARENMSSNQSTEWVSKSELERSTPRTYRISVANVAKTSSGLDGLEGRNSLSKQQTQLKQTGDSSPWPRNADELAQLIRQRRKPH